MADGVLVSLSNGAVQFLVGADLAKYDTGVLRVFKGSQPVGIYSSGSWDHAQIIRDWPNGFYRNEEFEAPKSNIWVIESPEENDGIPGSPQP